MTEAEVRGAIEAIGEVRVDAAQGQPALNVAADLCSAADPAIDKEGCACCLRAAFEESLRGFCERREVAVPWRQSADQIEMRALWHSAKAHTSLNDPAQAAFVSGIDAAAWLFLDDLDATVIAARAPAEFRAALLLLEGSAAIGPSPPVRRTKLDEL